MVACRRGLHLIQIAIIIMSSGDEGDVQQPICESPVGKVIAIVCSANDTFFGRTFFFLLYN